MKGKLAPEIEALSEILTALEKVKTDEEKRWLLGTAASRIGCVVPMHLNKPQSGGGGGNSQTLNGKPKEFMRAKQPKSDTQRVACLAFYLTSARETAKFSTAELTKLNTEAAGPSLNMARAVDNATRQNHYLAVAGGGKKQITALGEDVVTALPDQVAVRELDSTAGKKRNRKPKAKAKTGKK